MTDTPGGAPAPPAPLVRITDDLPETSMLWRRVLTFVVVAASLLLIQHFGEKLTAAAELHSIIRWLVWLIIVMVLAYFTGATLKEWVSMVTALRAIRANLGQDKEGKAQ